MSDDGGDPACWLGAVCDLCGAFIDAADQTHRCRVPADRVTPESDPERSGDDVETS